jgi:hypothetical protein
MIGRRLMRLPTHRDLQIHWTAGGHMVLRSLRLGFGIAGAALMFGAAGAAAEPLDKDACGKLQSEKQALVVLGVDKEFAKGPEWAKTNLAQAELNLLKRYLSIEEQLKFRCGMAMVNLTIPPDEDGPDEIVDPASTSVPLPQRREEAMSGKAPAKPATPAATQPAGVVKPAAPKPAPKQPKAQSSWNTETAPVEAVMPAQIEQLDVAPKKGPRALMPGERG